MRGMALEGQTVRGNSATRTSGHRQPNGNGAAMAWEEWHGVVGFDVRQAENHRRADILGRLSPFRKRVPIMDAVTVRLKTATRYRCRVPSEKSTIMAWWRTGWRLEGRGRFTAAHDVGAGREKILLVARVGHAGGMVERR